MPRRFLYSLLLLPLFGVAMPCLAARFHSGVPTVPQCRDVTLRASYLAEEKPGAGAGFLLTLHNASSEPVSVPAPVPLSVHWYAFSAGHWLWRASSGSGGSLVNAFNERGPLFAVQLSVGSPHPLLHTIAPNGEYTWAVFSGGTPALRYRPGCEHCAYQGERQFRAVLAYAYLPVADDPRAGLLRCGLRSTPVVMPPLAMASADRHNSVVH